jgi:hypothetical protein
MKKRLLCLAAIALLTWGCASKQLAVTYHSDPPGAALYQGDHNFGPTPRTLYYQLTDYDRQAGYKLLQGTAVRWVSGAKAGVSSLRADLRNGTNQVFTFRRPDNAPGYDIDANFALQLERNRILAEQAEAQRQQAYWQMYNALQQQQAAQQAAQQRQMRQPLNCTSRAVGNYVYTDCY